MTVGNHFVRNPKGTCNSENAEPSESCLLRQNLIGGGKKKSLLGFFFPFLSLQMELSSYGSKAEQCEDEPDIGLWAVLRLPQIDVLIPWREASSAVPIPNRSRSHTNS